MKWLLHIAVLTVFAFAVNGCSHDSESSSGETSAGEIPQNNSKDEESSLIELDDLEGFKRMNARDSVIQLENNTRVKLDYDFYMGTHEITCGEFKEYLDQQEQSFFRLDNCETDSLPITGVTFYDAVLYANFRSKQAHLDTVYSYSQTHFDNVDHCVGMDGFSFNSKVDGFRLPTETEWVFAAQKDWNPTKSWNSDNSEYKAHPICSSETPESGLCDMAGNALEWVYDWKGELIDTLLTDFVGALDGGAVGERVVKGGSYKNLPGTIDLLNRSDIYVVPSSEYNDYLGFRLALGKIPNPVWMNGLHQVMTSSIFLQVNSATIQAWLGSVKVKLAFRNDVSGNLVYVDFGGWHPQVIEVVDTLEVFHPEISPDGKWVAFSTLFEGAPGKSALYVRRLDESGSSLVKLEVESAAIPRWKVLDNGDTVIVYVTDGENNKEESIFKSKGTWQVSFSQGKFGSPKKLMDGAYHGGIFRNLAVSGARLLRASIDGKDTLWYNGEQACNVSLAQDGSRQTLFLDFASENGRSFAGEKYGTHQRLFVADSVGKLLAAIPSPSGKSFDHTEWTVGEPLKSKKAIATLADESERHKSIVLVNIQDSSVKEILNGEELWHPCLWVQPRAHYESVGLELDSAGMYFDHQEGMVENSMKVKMRLFWDYKDSLEMIAVGSSRTERGFDPLQITKQFALNAGGCGAEMQTGIYFLRHYALNHAKSLKTVVVELSPDVFRWPLSALYTLLYNQAPGYIYDRNHDFWKSGVMEEFLNLVDENMVYSHEDSVKYVETWGLYRRDPVGWGDLAPVDQDSVFSKIELKNAQAVMDSLDALLAETADRNIRVIGVVYPQSPKYANTGSFGRHGAQRSYAKEILSTLDSLTLKYPHFVMMDENKMGQHDYTDDMAEDSDHLSALGAALFTRRLDSLVNRLE